MRPTKNSHMKNLLNSTLAFAVLALAITSCKKGDITSKRLDGTWKLSSGTLQSTETSTYNTTTSTTTINAVLDGATRKVTTTIVPTPSTGNPATSTNPYTEEYTFDRGEDAFTAKVTATNVSSYQDTYFTSSSCDFSTSANYAVTETETTTSTTTGKFTILGSTGDIEKNSRMTLEYTKSDDVETTKWTYKTTAGADVTTTLYTYDFNGGCRVADVTKTVNSSETYSAGSNSEIWTVKSMSSSEMVVDYSSSYSKTGSNPSSFTISGEKNYKQD